MPTAEMAEAQTPGDAAEPGAPIPKDTIDPELIKLARARPKIGLLTAAGMVFLCTFFVFRLGSDRAFGGEGDKPREVAVADVAAGKVALDSYVSLAAEPMMSHAIRATKGKGDPGLRVTPVRGSGERVWIVLDGVGWDPPITNGRYEGRLRRLEDLPFGASVREHAARSPRAMFALAREVRAGFATNTVKTVDGDTLTVGDGDAVAFDLVDPNLSTVVATFTPGTPDHVALLDATAWTAELGRQGITARAKPQDDRDKSLGQVRFDLELSVTVVTEKLEAAKLWAARVEPVTRHHDTTWGALKGSSPGGFSVGSTTIPDAQLDLIGVYATRGIPGDAYALIMGEVPQDYWYILPISIVVGAIGLLFLWALVRTVRRDVLPARAS